MNNHCNYSASWCFFFSFLRQFPSIQSLEMEKNIWQFSSLLAMLFINKMSKNIFEVTLWCISYIESMQLCCNPFKSTYMPPISIPPKYRTNGMNLCNGLDISIFGYISAYLCHIELSKYGLYGAIEHE